MENVKNDTSANKKYYPSSGKEKVHRKVLLLIDFYKNKGRPPKSNEEYNGMKLGIFFNSIKSLRTKLSEEDQKVLEDTGIYIYQDIKKGELHPQILLLIEFYKSLGRLPKVLEEYKGFKIGRFFYNIKTGSTRITEEDRRLLSSVGIDIPYVSKKGAVLLLIEFYQREGRVPKVEEKYANVDIGNFFYDIEHGKIKISKKDIKLLQNNGISIIINNK